MADKIFGAAGCNKSELKLVKRQPEAAAHVQGSAGTTTRSPR